MQNDINKIAKDTNIYLKKFLKKQNRSHLMSSMNYGLFPGGKKVRSKIIKLKQDINKPDFGRD